MHRLVAAAVVTAACLVTAPGTASARPVAPSDAQLSQAQQAQQAAAAQVGQLTAALAQAQSAAASAAAAADIALQDYEEKQAAWEEARVAAEAAAAAAAQAQAELQVGQDEVVAFARDSYMQGSTSAGARAFMTAGGPAELMERAALLETVGEHRVDVVAQLTVLQEQASAADATAQQTVVQADTLKAESATLLAEAQEQKVAALVQADTLAVQQVEMQEQLEVAQQTLYGLEGAREAAAAYAAQQAAAAPPAVSTTPRSNSGSSGSGSSNSGSSNSGSSNSGSGGSSRPAPAPAPAPAPPADTTAGTPSGSVVQTAIAAAKTQLGVAYSWGGGGSNGPSYGISPDTGVWGFDCSGLTQYAYARAGISIGGTSRAQWSQFSHRTVARDDLQAGDLVFWASGSNYNSIYHVALYLGGGKVIQAPQSNDVVRISSMWFGNDYFGAVRPTG
ncbi:C40 family peptidase [Modestobacter italicus]|uniref:C40 family peptidase n=1 Tax=Modestobacter italicus (strain DSM 44449 / CECT 9708 / BC 501) TaxID=2732864 RepID=UPI0027E07BD1|nr:NlpC/P60 family protein [Modestobacter italicus]